MKKILIISIGTILLIGLGALVLTFVNTNQSVPTTSPNGQNVTLPISNSIGQTNTASTTGTVKTKDFLKNPTTVKDPINAGYYYLGYHANEGVSDSTATSNPPYIIEYISATKYFNIALLKEPIGTTRSIAEQFLMADLGISQAQMCKLNYMVSVPNSVNSQFAGRNLGFSFCSGAARLPN